MQASNHLQRQRTLPVEHFVNPVELPDHAPRLRLLTRGAEVASGEEIAANPRSASVRLRAVERVRAAA